VTQIQSLLTEIRDRLKTIQPAKEVMDTKDLAAYTGFSESYIRALRAKYKIPFSKKGGTIRYLKRRIDAWLDEDTIRTAEDEIRVNKEQAKTPVLKAI
jgi:predicted DNA-binding transcriptional regulator AlpA